MWVGPEEQAAGGRIGIGQRSGKRKNPQLRLHFTSLPPAGPPRRRRAKVPNHREAKAKNGTGQAGARARSSSRRVAGEYDYEAARVTRSRQRRRRVLLQCSEPPTSSCREVVQGFRGKPTLLPPFPLLEEEECSTSIVNGGRV